MFANKFYIYKQQKEREENVLVKNLAASSYFSKPNIFGSLPALTSSILVSFKKLTWRVCFGKPICIKKILINESYVFNLKGGKEKPGG
jgi:hypothetical protein